MAIRIHTKALVAKPEGSTPQIPNWTQLHPPIIITTFPKNYFLLGFRNGRFPGGYLSAILTTLTTMHYNSVKTKQKCSHKSASQILSLPHRPHPKMQKVEEIPRDLRRSGSEFWFMLRFCCNKQYFLRRDPVMRIQVLVGHLKRYGCCSMLPSSELPE